jgi:glycosyltransferase involved in cell wall biosynthesis
VIERRTGKGNRVFTILERIGGSIGSGMITVCRAEQLLAEENGIISTDKTFLVHNGIPDCSERSDAGRRELNVLMVARFQEQKDHVTLIRALAMLGAYPWRLQLVGSGPLMSPTREFARSVGVADRVEFLGERADVSSLLARSTIFVLSTLWEAFPISILEAMRAELPIIASNVGGVREAIIDEVNGILVPPLRPDVMAQKLKLLFDQPDLRERLARTARQDFLRFFTADRMVDNTVRIYDAIVGTKPMRVALGSPDPSTS